MYNSPPASAGVEAHVSIEPSWGAQAVTALDLSAMAASENIAGSNADDQRSKATVHDDFLGGHNVPIADDTELTTRSIATSEGPGVPLHVSGGLTDYETGLIRPVAGTGEGSAMDYAVQTQAANQLDQAFSSNLASLTYTDQQYLGRIVDYVA